MLPTWKLLISSAGCCGYHLHIRVLCAVCSKATYLKLHQGISGRQCSLVPFHSNAFRHLWKEWGDSNFQTPNDTAYKQWSCHSGLKLLCKSCQTFPPPACRPCGPAGWLALLLTKAGDVETNPGPTTLNKQVWICDICHEQIHVRKQISIRCNRIEHWVHLRCAGIRHAQYTDTWTVF